MGAEVVSTACPYCRLVLGDGLKHHQPDGDKQTVSPPIEAHANPKTFEEPAVPTAVAEDVPAACGPAGP